MAGPQEVYNKYIDEFGYPPKKPEHLMSFARKQGGSIKYGIARKLIKENASNTSSNIKPKSSYTLNKTTTKNTSNAKPNHSKLIQQEQVIINDAGKMEEKSNDDIDEKNDKLIINKQNVDNNDVEPIMCRVNYECSSENAKKEIYAALRCFVDLQLKTPNPAVITYHFTCPDPENNPLNLEFTELYLHEKVYWEHGKDKSFGNAFFKAFTSKNLKSRCFITISKNISNMVKNVNKSLDSTFPCTEAGYLLHDNYLNALDYTNNTKMMVKIHITSPKYYQGNKQNVSLIFDILNKLSVYAAKSYAVMFNAHRMNEKIYPDRLELVSIWPNDKYLLEFVKNKNVENIIMELKNLMIKETQISNRKNHFLCQLYGDNITDDILLMIQNIFDEIGYTQTINSDIGYIIHPLANSNHLKE